jgi:hypothetical protein
MSEQPPELAESLLRWLVGGRDADAVSGDLRESFAARGGGGLWYCGQALSCIAVRLSPHRRMLPGLGQDFQYALRTIRRNPGYALTAMLCLGLAMGVNATLFGLLDSVFFRKLPVPDAGRIVHISRQRAQLCTWREFLGFRDDLRSVETAAALTAGDYVDIGRANLMLAFEAVSANYAQVLRIGASSGRWFRPEEDSPASAPVAVISHRLWQTQLQSDPGIVGKQLLLHEQPYRIVGVGPPGFGGVVPPVTADVWVPVASFAGLNPWMNLVARLPPGATVASAPAEMQVIDARLRSADPRNSRLASPVTVQPASGIFWANGRKILLPVLSLMVRCAVSCC